MWTGVNSLQLVNTDADFEVDEQYKKKCGSFEIVSKALH